MFLSEESEKPLFRGQAKTLWVLVQKGMASARELATTMDITPVAVRLHLRNLMAKSLVEVVIKRAERPGHPEQIWAATPAGRVLVLPKRYTQLALALLHSVKGEWGDIGLAAVMDEAARRYVAQLDLPTVTTFAERQEQLLNTLAGLGVPARLEGKDKLALLGTICPADMRQRLPEAYIFYQAMAEAILGVPCKMSTRVKPPAACLIRFRSPVV